MLTFMNSKLTKMTGKDKQNHIFQKSKSYEISSTDICKKTSNLIEGISSHSICSGYKSQQVKKAIWHLVPKMFDFSLAFL